MTNHNSSYCRTIP